MKIIEENAIEIKTIKANKQLYVKQNEIIKRSIDIIVSIIGIMLLVPITLIVKIINILNGERGTIFYLQTRIGKNEKKFKIYKFRTM